MGRKIDLTGQRFDRLVVICENGRSKSGHVMWKCQCDCGNEVTVQGIHLRSGDTTSCGCYSRERSSERITKRNTKHGMSKTSLYYVWCSMLTRTGVYKGASQEAKRAYIDRNITLCPEWHSFENFREWSQSHGYSDGLEIDRIDNNRGYEPSNCRWITHRENVNNRRCTVRLDDGTSLAVFCHAVGIPMTENGNISKQYGRILMIYSKRHKPHPELLKKASETIALYKKTVELRKLLAEVQRLKADVDALRKIIN